METWPQTHWQLVGKTWKCARTFETKWQTEIDRGSKVRLEKARNGVGRVRWKSGKNSEDRETRKLEPDGNNDLRGSWRTSHLSYKAAKNVAALCPGPGLELWGKPNFKGHDSGNSIEDILMMVRLGNKCGQRFMEVFTWPGKEWEGHEVYGRGRKNRVKSWQVPVTVSIGSWGRSMNWKSVRWNYRLRPYWKSMSK